jgi:hypothetical protein
MEVRSVILKHLVRIREVKPIAQAALVVLDASKRLRGE